MTLKNQNWDPKQYQTKAGYVTELGRPMLDLLAPKPGEKVLDLGCGDGILTLKITRAGADVIGIDASEEMVEAACASGVEAYVGNGAALPYDGEFDAVFTNASLHWIKPPESVVSGVWQALLPGGRFVGEFGGSGNVFTIIDAIESVLGERGIASVNPWFFPSKIEYTAMLQDIGFTVHVIELFSRPTPLPGDVRGWLETFAQHYLLAVSEQEREGLISELVADLKEKITDEEGNWFADYVRLRFYAEKPRFSA